MSGAPDTPFLRKLGHFVDLTQAEIEALHALERDGRTLGAGEVLVREGGRSDSLFVVRSGWLYGSAVVKDGARQILRISFPGDLVNTSALAWSRVAATLTAGAETEVSEFPRSDLTTVFEQHPRLAALLYSLSMVENVSLADRLSSIGRTDGKARIAAFLLELITRLRLTDPTVTDSLELTLTQTDLGDAVGLTKVHVNRMLKQLTEDGLIERVGRRVRLADEAELVRFSRFIDRQADLAVDWFPPPR